MEDKPQITQPLDSQEVVPDNKLPSKQNILKIKNLGPVR